MIADLRRAFGLLDRRDSWWWSALVPLAVFVAALETAGAGAIFLLVRLLADPAHAQLPSVFGFLPRAGNPQAATRSFVELVVAFYLVRNLALTAIEFVRERVVHRTSARLAVHLFIRYVYAPYPFHFSRTSSALVHSVHENVEIVVEYVLAALVHLASELCVVAGLLALLAVTAPSETAAAVTVVIVLVLAPLALTRRLFTRWGEDERALREQLLADLHQSLDTIKTATIMGRQDYFVRRYTHDRRRLTRLKVRRSEAGTLLRFGIETAFILGMLLAVVMLTANGRAGAAAVSTLGLFAYAGFRIVPSANRIVLSVSSLRFGRAFVSALAADWTQLSEPAAPPLATAVAAPPAGPPGIQFDDVSYAYGDGRGHAVRDMSFIIAPGESVGIIGPTGAGKSTVVDLMLGLLTPASGRILVDGRDMQDDVHAWQAQIGYVPQEVVLVDDTLRRNIAFGIDDAMIDAARVAEVTWLARLDALVASLPGGLDHVLGERGTRLSGGERQRIAIARALYSNPAVMVFDEATSALDQETAREIVEAIDAVKGSRTVIVVAHNMTMVSRCDRLLLVEAGRVTRQGRVEDISASIPATTPPTRS